ncbi:borderless isoform X2 [Lycorma delicatula]|uniref:borderless isoform X2 n=1 Tax=Lycorma delicatula TaxID=130591 RepID=UPI003F51087A
MTSSYKIAVGVVFFFAILPGPGFPFIEEEKKATFLTANVGDSVVFNCQLDFPHDVIIPYILQWKKKGETVFSWHEGILHASDAYDNRIGLLPPDSPYGKGSINLTSIRETDAGWYECRVYFPNRTPSTRLNGTWFHLTVDDKAKIVFSPQEKYLPYGRPAILDCHFRANPPLTKLRWEKDGFLFDPFNVQGVFYRRNGSLYFSKVDESHGGDYVCTPFNELGTEGPSPPIHVIIQRPPVFTLTPQNLYLRKKGDSLEIPCDALDGDGTHRPTIHWFKKDGSPLPKGRSFVTGGNLTIANIEENDTGHYQCVASNEAATITSETEIMIENSSPRAPYNLTANSTMTSITLKWIPGYSKPQLEYSVWFRKLDVAEWRTTRIAKGAIQITINNLLPGQEYELMVLSQDQRGDGMFSKALRYKTKGPGLDENNELKKPLETFQQIGPPQNLRVKIDVEGYKVSWDPPDFGADLLRVYTVSWYEGDKETELIKADTTGTSFIVKDLEENKTYHFQVTAMSTNDYESTSERFTIYVPDYHKARVINIGVAVGLMLIFATGAGIWYVKNVYRRTSHKQAHFDDS